MTLSGFCIYIFGNYYVRLTAGVPADVSVAAAAGASATVTVGVSVVCVG